jgi:hypothetical protein
LHLSPQPHNHSDLSNLKLPKQKDLQQCSIDTTHFQNINKFKKKKKKRFILQFSFILQIRSRAPAISAFAFAIYTNLKLTKEDCAFLPKSAA